MTQQPMALAPHRAPDCLNPATRVIGEFEPLSLVFADGSATRVPGELDLLEDRQDRFAS
jgi:hypothetical protein